MIRKREVNGVVCSELLRNACVDLFIQLWPPLTGGNSAFSAKLIATSVIVVQDSM